MIKKEKRLIKNITELDAQKIKAYDLVDSKYDNVKKEFEFYENNATEKGFRLAHDGKIAFVIKGRDDDVTSCIHNIEEFDTEEKTLEQIKKLGLICVPETNDNP